PDGLLRGANALRDRQPPLPDAGADAIPSRPVVRYAQLRKLRVVRRRRRHVARQQPEAEVDETLDRHLCAPVPRRREDRLETVADQIDETLPSGADVGTLL